MSTSVWTGYCARNWIGQSRDRLRTLGLVVLGACAILVALPARASIVTFEELTDGTAVRDFYLASQGVTFDLATAIESGLSLNELEFPPHGGVNVAYDNTGPVSIVFASPVRSVFAYFTYLESLQLFAYDSLGQLLQSANSRFGNNTALSGDVGSSPNEWLGFSLSSPTISRLEVRANPLGSSFVFDDLTFSSGSVSVPEPGVLGLAALALAIAGLARRLAAGRSCASATERVASLDRVPPSFGGVPSAIVLAMSIGLMMASQASAQDQARQPRVTPSSKTSTINAGASATALTPIQIARIKTTPSAIPNGIPSSVVIEADVAGSGVLPNGVSVQVIDDNGKILRSLGTLNDAGAAPDALAGDGRYSGTFMLNQDVVGSLRLVISVAVRNTLLRSVSNPFYLNVSPDVSVFNLQRDLWAANNGPAGIMFWFENTFPSGAERLRLLRSSPSLPAWTEVWTIDLQASSSPSLPLFDAVDGSTDQYTYRLQVLGAGDAILKEFGSVSLPRFPAEANSPATKSSKVGLAALAAANVIDPVVNTAFISDPVYEDHTSMTAQQILDFLTQKGSFLATPSLTDTIKDIDGVAFSPATYIKQLASTHRINPQLILVSMEKEAGLVRAGTFPLDNSADGYMGAKGCLRPLRLQLQCGVSRLREYLTELDTQGQTRSGWKPHVSHKTCAGPNCSWEQLDVTPANRATAALWTYTPVIGAQWGGTPKAGGTGLNVLLWYPSFFKNLTHIVRWKDCGLCPQAPQLSPGAGDQRGAEFTMGAVPAPSEGDRQPMSRHGLSGRLPANSSYTVEIDCSLNTWDSYNAVTAANTGYWDVFLVSLSSVPHWLTGLGDPITAPYLFGGKNYGDGLPDKKAEKFKRTIAAGSLGQPYLNILFDTASAPQFDTNYPSWGQCKVLTITPTDKLADLGLIRMPD